MTRILLLALLMSLPLVMETPAHADTRYCNGILTSNGVCTGSESNVPPVIIRCDYADGSNSDPRCVGVGPTDRPSTAERPHKKSPS
jgi:hypothetical protein